MATHKINNVVTNYDVKNNNTKIGKAFFGRILAADTDGLLESVALTNSSKTSLVRAVTDVPRNVTIAVTDTTASIVAGTATITGLDVNGNIITEKLNITAAALAPVGSKIFKKITSVVFADFAAEELGGTGDEVVIVGWGTKIGLPLSIGQRLVTVKEILVDGAAEAESAVDYGNGSVVFTTAPNGTGIYEVTFEFAEDL